MATKYTSDMVDTMVGTYNAAVDEGADYAARTSVVKTLAEQFKLTEGQVRSKLVNEGVYLKASEGKTTAAKVGSKEDYRKAFEAATGLNLASMESMTKKDLIALWNWQVNTYDRAIADAKSE